MFLFDGFAKQDGFMVLPFMKALIALRAVRPELTERQAAEQTTDAIYYASYAHPAWLWRGVGEDK